MSQSKNGLHYAWLIFIGLCFLGVGGFPLIFNLVGIYMVPVSTALGLDMASFSLWLSAEAVVSLVVMPIAGRLFKAKHTRAIMTVGMLCCVVGVLGFSFASELWHVIVLGCLLGVGVPFAFGLPQTVLIGNWFAKKYQARMMSVAMACLVCAPIFEAPIFTMLLNTYGYQTTYIINAICIAVFTLPWCIFVFKRAPEDMGLKPFGYSEESDSKEEENDLKVGTSPGAAAKSPAFWLVLLSACLICFAMGFQNYSVAIAGAFLPGETPESAAMFGSTMISVFSVGSLLGTFLFGFLLGKDKFRPTFILFLTLFLCGMLLWLLWHSKVGLLIGAVCLGTHNGLATVGFPMLLRRLFGGKNYSVIYSYVNMCSSTVGGFSSTILGLIFGVFDLTGALIFGVCVAVAIYICSMAATTFVGKIKWSDEEPAAESK